MTRPATIRVVEKLGVDTSYALYRLAQIADREIGKFDIDIEFPLEENTYKIEDDMIVCNGLYIPYEQFEDYAEMLFDYTLELHLMNCISPIEDFYTDMSYRGINMLIQYDEFEDMFTLYTSSDIERRSIQFHAGIPLGEVKGYAEELYHMAFEPSENIEDQSAIVERVVETIFDDRLTFPFELWQYEIPVVLNDTQFIIGYNMSMGTIEIDYNGMLIPIMSDRDVSNYLYYPDTALCEIISEFTPSIIDRDKYFYSTIRQYLKDNFDYDFAIDEETGYIAMIVPVLEKAYIEIEKALLNEGISFDRRYNEDDSYTLMITSNFHITYELEPLSDSQFILYNRTYSELGLTLTINDSLIDNLLDYIRQFEGDHKCYNVSRFISRMLLGDSSIVKEPWYDNYSSFYVLGCKITVDHTGNVIMESNVINKKFYICHRASRIFSDVTFIIKEVIPKIKSTFNLFYGNTAYGVLCYRLGVCPNISNTINVRGYKIKVGQGVSVQISVHKKDETIEFFTFLQHEYYKDGQVGYLEIINTFMHKSSIFSQMSERAKVTLV